MATRDPNDLTSALVSAMHGCECTLLVRFKVSVRTKPSWWFATLSTQYIRRQAVTSDSMKS